MTQSEKENEEAKQQPQGMDETKTLEMTSVTSKYTLISKLGEGGHGNVYKARSKADSTKSYAVKVLKDTPWTLSNAQYDMELDTLKRLAPHRNIVKLEEMIHDAPTQKLAYVFELVDGNLYQHPTQLGKASVKSLMHQLYSALDHLHDNGLFHRNIKPENILINKDGTQLKLAGFGRTISHREGATSTGVAGTRWYRSPEHIMNHTHSKAMDVWGAGCVHYEMLTLLPLFDGREDGMIQLDKIHEVLGTPENIHELQKNEAVSDYKDASFTRHSGIGLSKLLPDAEDDCLDLLKQSLAYDASKRITAKAALSHPCFNGVGHLSSYRIGTLHAGSREAELAQSHGASILNVHEVAPESTQKEFESWWSTRAEEAEADKKHLVVLTPPTWQARSQKRKWLDQMEEEDWDTSGDFGKVRFVTRKTLKDAIESDEDKVVLRDSWGDKVK